MRPLVLAVTGAVVVAVACTVRSVPSPAVPPSSAALARAGGARADSQLAAGRRVAQATCLAACHTEQPPPKLAPPLAMVAMHYRQATRDSAEAVERLASWIAAPAAERSLLPRMAIERFGLMPPLALPDSQRRAVAVYVLSLRHAGMGPMGHPMTMPPRRPGGDPRAP